MRVHSSIVLFTILSTLACRRESPVTTAAISAHRATPVASAVPSSAPSCEVEVSGRVTTPAGAKPPANTFVYVAAGDCLAPDARMLGRVRALQTGKYFLEVFSAWGSDLTLCAAVEETPGAPTTLYGDSSKRHHAAAEGEVLFTDVVIVLKSGASRSFPQPPM